MNDKQQLAAMGAQYRLTEEQAKGLAERMPQTGALQVIDDEPLCMAKRIEGLEAPVRVMASALSDAVPHVALSVTMGLADNSIINRFNVILDGQLSEDGVTPAPIVPIGWKLVPVEPTLRMLFCGGEHIGGSNELPIECWYDMLAVAPSPDCAK